MSTIATLADLRQYDTRLAGQCLDCGRERVIDPHRIELPAGTAVLDIGRRMKCRDCGSRRILTAPAAESEVL